MTPAELEAFLATLAHDDGAAARSHLNRGNPVYCTTTNTPAGLVEKRFPDGRRPLVRFDLNVEHVVQDDVQSEAYGLTRCPPAASGCKWLRPLARSG